MKKMSKYARERQLFKNKPRKVLNLEERVQALRMFEQTPVYQRVASAFKCSWEQIKNVVLSRDEILLYYARCQTVMPGDQPNQARKKKIIFLGNVVFEYIKRAHYHGTATLNEESIRERALAFRDAIEIEQFYPNNAWLADFKRVFGINFQKMEDLVVTHAPPKTLDCKEIIAYCRQEIQQTLCGKENTSLGATQNKMLGDINNGSAILSPALDNYYEENENLANNSDGDFNEMDYQDEDDVNEDEEGPTIDFSYFESGEVNDSLKVKNESKNSHIIASRTVKAKNAAATLAKPQFKASTPVTIDRQARKAMTASPLLVDIKEERCSDGSSSGSSPPSPEPSGVEQKIGHQLFSSSTSKQASILPQILNPSAALVHLIPLQDYALGEEDFYAVNLLSKLAAHFERSTKRRVVP